MTRDEQYAWSLVHAAIGLPKPSLPYAAHLLGVAPLNALPAETRARLYYLLHALGDVERSPAVDAFLGGLASATCVSDAQRSPQWHTLRVLQQERHVLAALDFMQSVASAGLQRAESDAL